MRILHLVSCRGWSSDAYWAARAAVELERAGHTATLVCRHGSEGRVIDRARALGVRHIERLAFAGGIRPVADMADLGRLLGWLPGVDVVHAHRGKEHWLAALANRLSFTPRPLVRTRHIVQPIRPHALNRWLYRGATDRVVTVTEAIRRQCVAAELSPPERVVALAGGVDLERFAPATGGGAVRRSLGIPDGVPVVGLVSGFRVMKGHAVAVEAAARLRDGGRRFHLLLAGQGALEGRIREALAAARLLDRVSIAGFVDDLPSLMAALDVALYVPLESDGMSRVLFEYLAMARPVVASRIGVVPEVLKDGETALLVPAGEAGALAAAVGRLLDDATLRRRLGAAARALTEARLSGARLATALVALYGELLTR